MADSASADPPATQPRLHASALIRRRVFEGELREIAHSRSLRSVPPAGRALLREYCSSGVRARSGSDARSRPERILAPAQLNLCGLALSGGGIRSATFSLGVLQAMAEAGKLRFVDYLSTVSGGGYIGSSWSALLARCSTTRTRDCRPPDFPFVHVPIAECERYPDGRPRLIASNFNEAERWRGNEDPAALEHVRDFANYLIPRGLRDQIRIPSLLLRGIVVNILVILPYLLLTVAAFLACYGWRFGPALTFHLFETQVAEHAVWTPADAFLVTPWLLPGYVVVIVGLLVLATLIERCAPGMARERPPRHPAPARGLVGRMAAPVLWLIRTVASFGMPDQRGREMRLALNTALLIGIAAVILWELQPFLLWKLTEGGGVSTWLTDVWALLTGIGAIASALIAALAADSESTLRRRAAFLAVGLLAPVSLWLAFLYLARWAVDPASAPALLLTSMTSGGLDPSSNGAWITLYVAVAVALLLWSWIFVDANATSLHRFYRDQLSKAFMLGLDREGSGPWRVTPHDRVRLSDIRPRRTGGPYHLINATANSPEFEPDDDRIGDLSQRGRRSAFFVFSPCWCGSERLGYARTASYERADQQLDLATAMAISGAAVAPVMGQRTRSPLLTFLLAMLNVRLGYWLPKPQSANEGDRLRFYAGPIYFLLELIGIPPSAILCKILPASSSPGSAGFFHGLRDRLARRDMINLSDGGHLDNLGVFELLRRRCRYIIAIDGERDPAMTFNGLATVQRLALTDLGIKIDFDVEDLRLQDDESGLSRRHFTLARIDYGDGQIGELLYIKSSLTGSEIEYIKEYRARNPDFPHQSTGDQFFDEAQFEAYRALGHATGEELCGPRFAHGRTETRLGRGGEQDERPEETAEAFFFGLRQWLRPAAPFRRSFIELGRSRQAIEKLLDEDDDVMPYTKEVLPELGMQRGRPANGADDDHGGRKITTSRQGEQQVRPGLGEAADVFDMCPAVDRSVDVDGSRLPHLSAPGFELSVLRLVSQKMQFMEHAVLALRLNEPTNQHHPRNRGLMNLFRRWARSPSFRRHWALAIANYSDTLQVFGTYALGLEFDVRWRTVRWTKLRPAERAIWLTAAKELGEQRRAKPRHCLVAEVRPMDWMRQKAPDDEPIEVGFAVVHEQGSRCLVRVLRVRRPFRDLGLADLLAEALCKWARDDRDGKSVTLATPDDGSRSYGYLADVFRRQGLEVDPKADRPPA